MKIKTLKIKVEKENQEFDFKDFFVGSNTIYQTTAQIVKEEDGVYWYAFITYEPKNDYLFVSQPTPKKELPQGFETEIMAYIQNMPVKKSRITNAVINNMERLLDVKVVADFFKFRNVSRKKTEEDNEFFEAILGIIKKYQS